MAAPKLGWLACGTLVIACAIVLAIRWQVVAQLRTEIRLKREELAELGRLRAAREELKRDEVPAAELENLRADRAAVTRLRTEMEMVKASTGKKATSSAAMAPPQAPPLIPASAWKNAGRATPEAALETALWAAVGGDVDVLAHGIEFEPGGRAKIQALIATLPPAAQAQYPTPEHLVALLTAKDIPTEGGMRVVVGDLNTENAKRLAVAFQNDTKVQSKSLIVHRDGEEWKLVVPNVALEKYVSTLRGPGPSNNGK